MGEVVAALTVKITGRDQRLPACEKAAELFFERLGQYESLRPRVLKSAESSATERLKDLGHDTTKIPGKPPLAQVQLNSFSLNSLEDLMQLERQLAGLFRHASFLLPEVERDFLIRFRERVCLETQGASTKETAETSSSPEIYDLAGEDTGLVRKAKPANGANLTSLNGIDVNREGRSITIKPVCHSIEDSDAAFKTLAERLKSFSAHEDMGPGASICLDMSHVTHICMELAGAIYVADAECRKRGGSFAITNIQPKPEETLKRLGVMSRVKVLK